MKTIYQRCQRGCIVRFVEVGTNILVRRNVKIGMITRHHPRLKPSVLCCGTPFSGLTLRGTSDGHGLIIVGDGEGTQRIGVVENGDKRHSDCEFEVSVEAR